MGGVIDGPTVYVGAGSMGITNVGAGTVLIGEEIPRVAAVVGLVVADEGERVES